MTERETESKRPSRRARGLQLTRFVYGSLLVALGACIGIVIGSVSDTPRVFLERLRGPVETVDLEKAAPEPVAEAAEAPPLQAFDELQGAPAKPAPKQTAAVTPPAAPPKPAPAAKPVPAPAPAATTPPVASPPPPAAPAATAKSAEEIVKSLEQKTAAAPAPGTKSQVIQVLSLAERKQADALVAKLKTQGYESYVTAMPDKSGRFRVRVRPGVGQSAAQLEPKLKALGLKTWITVE